MAKNKTVLCSWTGGLDSTAMVLQYLGEGNTVIPVYTEMKNNPNKTNRELAALEELRPLMPHNCLLGYTRKMSIEIPGGGNSAKLPQSFAMLSALAYSVYEDVDEVAIGYVMNDDAISFLPEIQAVWESMLSLMWKPPPLLFPMKQKTKTELWFSLTPEMRRAVTWCEDEFHFHATTKYCGKCVPCRKMDFLEIPHLRTSTEKSVGEVAFNEAVGSNTIAHMLL